MIGVVAKLKIQEDKADDFEAACKDLMAKVKANESGCLTYQLYKSDSDENTYVFMEEYASQADLDAHGKTEYFAAAMPAIGACLAGAPDIQTFKIVE